MHIIFTYLRLVLFLGGVLVGIQVPGFVDQYGKSLEAHFRESNMSLLEFRKDADRFFEGDIEKLISHYKTDADPVFNGGGDGINSIYLRNVELNEAVSSFRESPFRAYLHVFFNSVADVREEVWKNYTYSIKLDLSAISIGLLAGLILAAMTESFVRGVFRLAGILGRKIAPKSLRIAR